MPTFEELKSDTSLSTLKILYLGDSGAGKTGSCISLAAAGLNVRILDLDNGVEVIRDFATNPKSIYLQPRPGLWTAEVAKDTAKRISYVTVTETMNTIQGRIVPKADAWGRITGQLNNWVDGERKFGNVSSWGPRDVLVLDGLTKFSDAAWHYQLAMNNRLLTRPEQSDYWKAQELVSDVLGLLQGSSVSCNVIVICHIKYIENDSTGLTRGYPESVGKALSPTISRDFNHTLLARSTGQGVGIKRKILTATVGTIDLKTTAPLRVKPEYDLETGLAEYFRDVLGPSIS